MKQQLSRVVTHVETKHTAHLLLGVIVSIFMVVELHELYEVETFPDYFDHVVPYLTTCELDEIPNRIANNGESFETRSPLKWWSLCFSNQVLGNERIIPFLFSIILIPVTYSFVTHLTQRRFTAIIAVLVLVSSGTFLNFNTTATYEQSWVVFLLLSLIFVLRGSTVFMIVFFLLALASKPITIIYLPVLFGFANLKDNDNMKIALLMTGALVALVVLMFPMNMTGGVYEINFDELLHGFYNWWFYLNASLLVAMTLPLVVWRLFSMRKKHPEAKPILIAILIIIVSVPLIDGFTNQLNHAYRFVPMIIFAGIGIAMIITNFVSPKEMIFNIRKSE